MEYEDVGLNFIDTNMVCENCEKGSYLILAYELLNAVIKNLFYKLFSNMK
jgi:hypothetical protein